MNGSQWYVEMAKGVFCKVGRERVVLLPASRVGTAKAALESNFQLMNILRMAETEPIIVTHAALRRLSTCLNSLVLGKDAVCGLVLVSAAPALLDTTALTSFSANAREDSIAHRVTRCMAATGAALGVAGMLSTISELTAVAAGGGSMAAGLAACAAPMGAGVVAGSIAWAICQRIINNITRMQQWKSEGTKMPMMW